MDYRHKQKFVSVGSSLAVVIPKPVCRLLRLDRTTEVELRLSDNQIVLRPLISANRVGQPDRLRVGRVLTILVKNYDFHGAAFARLSADGTSMRRFADDVNIGGRLDVLTVARLEECLARRRELDRTHTIESWNDTVDAILLQLPSPIPPSQGESLPKPEVTHEESDTKQRAI